MKSFEDKRNLYLDDLSKSRGPNASNKTIEVSGGRTVMQYSNIFYTEKIGANSAITEAVTDFFGAADSSIDSDNTTAQHSAISGVKNLVNAAIQGILGDISIGARETESFNVLFMNNSFVRIDYRFFQQNIDVVKYLSEVRSTARLIVCELAVLPIEEMQPSEITYMLSQTFDMQKFSDPSEGLAMVGKLQCDLVQLSVLTRMLQQFLKDEDADEENEGADSSAIKERSEALVELSKNVDGVLAEIYKPFQPPSGDSPNAQGLLGGVTTRSAFIETGIKDRYLDAKLDADGIATRFAQDLQEFSNSNATARTDLLVKMKKMAKFAYYEFQEAYEDLEEAPQTWSTSYTAWYTSHKAEFPLWAFTFSKRVGKENLEMLMVPKPPVKPPVQTADLKLFETSEVNFVTEFLNFILNRTLAPGENSDEDSADYLLSEALKVVKGNEDPTKYRWTLDNISLTRLEKGLRKKELPKPSSMN
mmetsp:Transcript_5650/g.8376  ORF Transcript_5650/g.8376 Transcript_5650/m.8376 type:complete len:475 (-) Transcript_5650:259-1683(-)